MPGWLISLLVSLAIKIGFPLLVKKFPKLPPGILDIIQKLVEDLNNPDKSKVEKSLAKKDAIRRVKEKCSGVACQNDLKK